jgi:hypothetical protein
VGERAAEAVPVARVGDSFAEEGTHRAYPRGAGENPVEGGQQGLTAFA